MITNLALVLMMGQLFLSPDQGDLQRDLAPTVLSFDDAVQTTAIRIPQATLVDAPPSWQFDPFMIGCGLFAIATAIAFAKSIDSRRLRGL